MLILSPPQMGFLCRGLFVNVSISEAQPKSQSWQRKTMNHAKGVIKAATSNNSGKETLSQGCSSEIASIIMNSGDFTISWDRVSLCSQYWPWHQYETKSCFPFIAITLTCPPECWEYRCELPWLTKCSVWNKISTILNSHFLLIFPLGILYKVHYRGIISIV